MPHGAVPKGSSFQSSSYQSGRWVVTLFSQPPSQTWPTQSWFLCQRADLKVAPAAKTGLKKQYSRPKTWTACCEKRKELMGVWGVVMSIHLVETGRRCSLERDFQMLEGVITLFLDFHFLLIPDPCPERPGNYPSSGIFKYGTCYHGSAISCSIEINQM